MGIWDFLLGGIIGITLIVIIVTTVYKGLKQYVKRK